MQKAEPGFGSALLSSAPPGRTALPPPSCLFEMGGQAMQENGRCAVDMQIAHPILEAIAL